MSREFTQLVQQRYKFIGDEWRWCFLCCSVETCRVHKCQTPLLFLVLTLMLYKKTTKAVSTATGVPFVLYNLLFLLLMLNSYVILCNSIRCSIPFSINEVVPLKQIFFPLRNRDTSRFVIKFSHNYSRVFDGCFKMLPELIWNASKVVMGCFQNCFGML